MFSRPYMFYILNNEQAFFIIMQLVSNIINLPLDWIRHGSKYSLVRP